MKYDIMPVGIETHYISETFFSNVIIYFKALYSSSLEDPHST